MDVWGSLQKAVQFFRAEKICSESIATITSSIRPEELAVFITHWASGRPFRGLIFFRGIDFDPLLRGIKALIINSLKGEILIVFMVGDPELCVLISKLFELSNEGPFGVIMIVPSATVPTLSPFYEPDLP